MLPKAPRRLLALFSLLLVTAVGSLLWADAHDDYTKSFQQLESDLEQTTKLLAEHARISLAAADLLLTDTATTVERQGLDALSQERGYWEALRATLGQTPQVYSFVVADAQGIVRFSTTHFPMRPVDITDREYFQAIRAGARHAIGEPIVGRGSGRQLMPIALRLESADGGFAGALAAMVDVEYFKTFYAALADKRVLRIGMFRLDGTPVALMPAPSGNPSATARGAVATQLNQAPVRTFRIDSPFDGRSVIVSSRHLADYPLAVTTTVDYQTFVAGLYPGIWRNTAVFGLFTAAVLIATVLLARTIRAAEKAHAAERRSNAFLQGVLDTLDAHAAIIDENGDFLLRNKAWRDFGRANGTDGSGGNYFAAGLSAAEPDRTQAVAAVRAVLERQQDELVTNYACHSPEEERWFNMRVRRMDMPSAPLALMTHEDISNVMLANRQLLETERAHRETERLCRAIAHNLPNGRVGVFDQDLRYVFADGKGFSHINIEPQALIGKTIWDVYPQDVCNMLAPLFTSALAGMEADMELPVGRRTYAVSAIPLPSDDGQRRGLTFAHEITKLKHAQNGLEELNQQLQVLSARDPLLNIANRREFERLLEQAWRRGAREQTPLALLLIDADHFKHYNDAYGHPAGDACLQQLASVLTEAAARPGDLVARYGGEELAVLLPGADLAGALHVAERVHDLLAARALPFAASPLIDRVTVSIGAAAVQPDQDGQPSSLVANADTALYAAKHAGRNRTAATGQPAPHPQTAA